MNENKNIGSSAPENMPATDTYSDPDVADMYDDADPDAYWDEYLYGSRCCDSLCMSCNYWDGHMCVADEGICNYDPY